MKRKSIFKPRQKTNKLQKSYAHKTLISTEPHKGRIHQNSIKSGRKIKNVWDFVQIQYVECMQYLLSSHCFSFQEATKVTNQG